MDRILVDQSHCNYWLAQHLEEAGWRIAFTDAGRVTRGGGGTQGACLRVFEENGWPIPDIVCHSDGTILLFEIDATPARVHRSLATYHENREALGRLIWHAIDGEEVDVELMLGFCRTGVTARATSVVANARRLLEHADVVAHFSKPRTPILAWS